MRPVPVDDIFIIESFWQRAANCVSIALIKAAIMQYGTRDIFHIKKLAGHLLITLRDGTKLVLEQKEIRRINTFNKISFLRPRDLKTKKIIAKLKEIVWLCFAVMIRNLQLYGYAGKEYTRSAAISLLTCQGIHTDHMHRLLGLKRRKLSVQPIPKKNALDRFRRRRAVLILSDTHIAVASTGYYEDFGKAIPLGNTPPVLRRRKAHSWFQLK
jgi:hypothetical protein